MFDRRALLLGGLALTGCGFAPAFGTGGVAEKLRGAVVVESPATVNGFALSAQLQDRFGPLTTPRYRLSVTLEQNTSAAAINAEGDTTRLTLRSQAGWTLRAETGEVLLTGVAQTFTSYAATSTTVATQAAANDAVRRLSVALADLIVADITARAGDLP